MRKIDFSRYNNSRGENMLGKIFDKKKGVL